MATSRRVQGMVDELTPDERAELSAALHRPKLLPAADLRALLARLPKDPSFADDLEHVMQERRSGRRSS